jgi:hypothetical protein
MSEGGGSGRILQLRPVCAAIRTLAVLEFEYRGLHRIAAPYVHGFTTRGAEAVRAVQLRGESRSGGLGFGKLFLCAEMKRVRLGEEGFVPDDPDYNPDDGVFARIHCRVSPERRERR